MELVRWVWAREMYLALGKWEFFLQSCVGRWWPSWSRLNISLLPPCAVHKLCRAVVHTSRDHSLPLEMTCFMDPCWHLIRAFVPHTKRTPRQTLCSLVMNSRILFPASCIFQICGEEENEKPRFSIRQFQGLDVPSWCGLFGTIWQT